jgi:hypothetical protein
MNRTKSEVWADVQKLADSYRARNPALTHEQAIDTVISGRAGGPIGSQGLALMREYRSIADHPVTLAPTGQKTTVRQTSAHGTLKTRMRIFKRAILS